MNLTRSVVVVCGGVALLGSAACSSSSSGSATTAGGATTGTATTGTGTTTGSGGAGGGASAGGAGTGGTSTGAGGAAACAPPAGCEAVEKACLGLVDNKGLSKFGLRMAQLDVTAPQGLANGVLPQAIAGTVAPNDPACRLTGTASSSWLPQLDTAAQTLKTGGAKPVSDASKGYSFADEQLALGGATFHVQPATYAGVTPDGSGHFTASSGQDLAFPVYLDQAATEVLLLPLRALTFDAVTLSADQGCIGMYNAAGLDPGSQCVPDPTHPAFVTGGEMSAYITLEDADNVVVSLLHQSLCVLLSGDASKYGDGATPAKCKRDADQKILYQGGWCSQTDQAGGCADAEHFKAKFAASSVLIND
jgi:hypothetical protein